MLPFVNFFVWPKSARLANNRSKWTMEDPINCTIALHSFHRPANKISKQVVPVFFAASADDKFTSIAALKFFCQKTPPRSEENWPPGSKIPASKFLSISTPTVKPSVDVRECRRARLWPDSYITFEIYDKDLGPGLRFVNHPPLFSACHRPPHPLERTKFCSRLSKAFIESFAGRFTKDVGIITMDPATTHGGVVVAPKRDFRNNPNCSGK